MVLSCSTVGHFVAYYCREKVTQKLPRNHDPLIGDHTVMPRHILTDAFVRNIKANGDRQEFHDEGYHGRGTLILRIGAKGSRTWNFLYKFQGTLRRLKLGDYPDLSLAAARLKAHEAVVTIESGTDPAESVAIEKETYRETTAVGDLAKQFIELYCKPRKRSWQEDERILKMDVLPVLGHKKVTEVTRKDVSSLLDSIVARGAPIAANRTLAVVRKMFNWAVDRGDLEANPIAGRSAPTKEQSRDRVLTDAEIQRFWEGLNRASMDPMTALALKFMLVTAQRLGEVCTLRREHIDQGIWTIPADIAKNGKAHRVPLNPIALSLIDSAREVRHYSVVFSSPRGEDRVMSPTALSHALRKNLEEIQLENFHPHDLRRTAASHITMLGFNRLVVSKILNHADGGITAVYDRHSYDKEKSEALTAWSKKLERLTSEIAKQKSYKRITRTE